MMTMMTAGGEPAVATTKAPTNVNVAAATQSAKNDKMLRENRGSGENEENEMEEEVSNKEIAPEDNVDDNNAKGVDNDQVVSKEPENQVQVRPLVRFTFTRSQLAKLQIPGFDAIQLVVLNMQ